MVRAGLTAFGRFWWEFIVGDTPELAVGVALIIFAAWLLSATAVAVAVVPLAVVAVLAVSAWRGTRSG